MNKQTTILMYNKYSGSFFTILKLLVVSDQTYYLHLSPHNPTSPAPSPAMVEGSPRKVPAHPQPRHRERNPSITI